jgi:phosphoribosyl 1,2-cyclic phosphate phosphodiesterase
MKLTVLGSGGCAVIPKPLCTCSICREAREKGIPFSRTGPSVFLHDANLLFDTPAEISCQLNQSDIKPFPERELEVQKPDLLIIQSGYFEEDLKENFTYPPNHISRKTLYSFKETLLLSKRIETKQTFFVHLEEHWNRSHDDYLALGKKHGHIRFAYDGMRICI